MENNLVIEIKKIILDSSGSDLPLDEFSDDTLLIGNILDSMAINVLILSLEEKFHFRFDEEDLTAESFETVDALKVLIEKKIS